MNIEEKIKELEDRIEKLEHGKKPYEDPSERISPYDLSQLEEIKKDKK